MDPMQCFNELVPAFLAQDWEKARTHAIDLSFNELVAAFLAQDWEAARTHAIDLKDWLNKDGFIPLDQRDVLGFCNIVDRICRHHLERITTS